MRPIEAKGPSSAMHIRSGIPRSQGFYPALIRGWLAITRRKIRVLHAGDLGAEGAVLYAVSQPAGLLQAAVLSLSIQPPVRCLFPEDLARSRLAHFLASRLGMILYDREAPMSGAVLEQALEVLASRGALIMFAEQDATGLITAGKLAQNATLLLARAKTRHSGRIAAVRAVHVFMPEATPSREILVYIDSLLSTSESRTAPTVRDAAPPDLATALEARFRENAFQLRPRDLEFLLSDLEDVLRTSLQDEWASRADWKQDIEGFGLSHFVVDWVNRTNYLNPARLVALRNSLDDYRRTERLCARRELELHGADAPGLEWRRILLRAEALLGMPIALYGLVNHWAVLLVLLAAGSFKQKTTRSRRAEWILRCAVIVAFYGLQIYAVGHRWGRAAAGYYAPTLPVSGLYLWRYAKMAGPQIRRLLFSLTLPAMKKRASRLRQALLDNLDRALPPTQSPASSSD
jgi:hypothetical protein